MTNEGGVTTSELRIKYKVWGSGTRQFVSSILYQLMQFVSDTNDVKFGGTLQKEICTHLGIPSDYQEDFWNEEGCQSVEDGIRRKRGTLYNSVNSAFRRYSEKPMKDGDGKEIRPPDPNSFVPVGMLKGT